MDECDFERVSSAEGSQWSCFATTSYVFFLCTVQSVLFDLFCTGSDRDWRHTDALMSFGCVFFPPSRFLFLLSPDDAVTSELSKLLHEIKKCRDRDYSFEELCHTISSHSMDSFGSGRLSDEERPDRPNGTLTRGSKVQRFVMTRAWCIWVLSAGEMTNRVCTVSLVLGRLLSFQSQFVTCLFSVT